MLICLTRGKRGSSRESGKKRGAQREQGVAPGKWGVSDVPGSEQQGTKAEEQKHPGGSLTLLSVTGAMCNFLCFPYEASSHNSIAHKHVCLMWNPEGEGLLCAGGHRENTRRHKAKVQSDFRVPFPCVPSQWMVELLEGRGHFCSF